MSQSLRTLKLRIKSIENTRKITHAMEMVSSSKLNRVRNALFLNRPYFAGLEGMLGSILAGATGTTNQFLRRKEGIEKTALCVMTSDAGLCSVYNYSVIRQAEEFIKKYGKDKVQLITVGREGFNYFSKSGVTISADFEQIYGRYSDEISHKLYDKLTGIYLNGEADEIHIAYTHFTSTLRLKATIEKFLDIEYENKEPVDFIVEPDRERLLDELVPAYLLEKIRLIILDTFTSEHAARMIAMKMATDNARDLIDTLTLLRNKMRQASITKEILAVVMSAEALKG